MRFLRKNLAFVIMVASSACVFFANILARRSLNADDYELFSYFITIASIVISFGLLGTEQLIIRFGKAKNGQIELSRNASAITIVAFFISLGLAGLFVKEIFTKDLPAGLVLATSAALSSTLITYNLWRLEGAFVKAQIVSGAWRFLSFVIVFAASLGLVQDICIALTVALVIILLCNILLLLRIRRRIVLSTNDGSVISTALAFSFSLGIMTIIGNLDRIIAENSGIINLFSDYVYFSMIVIFPFNMIASYLGFKEAIHFKNSFSRRVLFAKTKNVFGVVSVLFMLTTVLLIVVREAISLSLNAWLIFGSYILVLSKCLYSLLSAAMGSLAKSKDIWGANLTSGAAIVLILAVAASFVRIDQIIDIVWLFSVLWMARSLCFLFYLRGVFSEV